MTSSRGVIAANPAGVGTFDRPQLGGMVKKLMVCALAVVLVIAVSSVAAAVRQPRLAAEAMGIEEGWAAWALGSSSNALLGEEGFCGEVVDGRFFLALTLGTGATELDCAIPSGVEAVASPFGALAWAPTDGKTGTKLFNSALGYLDGVVPKSVSVKVDGTALPREPMMCSLPFEVALEPGNSLQRIDSAVKGDSTKVVACAWMYLVEPLSDGQHTIDIGGKTKGNPGFTLRYNVTVA